MMIKQLAFFFSLLTTISWAIPPTCYSVTSKIDGDTTKPFIKSGFYLVINAKTDIAFRKLNSVTKNDVFNSKTFILSRTNYLPFSIIDSCYIQYSEDNKYYELYFRLNREGQRSFYDLTNKSNEASFLTNDGYAQLGTVVNNTLIQVASIIGPINGNRIALGGIFDEQTARNLLSRIVKE